MVNQMLCVDVLHILLFFLLKSMSLYGADRRQEELKKSEVQDI